jgi:hypothetical protein
MTRDDEDFRTIDKLEAILEFEDAAFLKHRGEGQGIINEPENPYWENFLQEGLIEKAEEENYRVTQKGVDFVRDLKYKQDEVSDQAYKTVFKE